MKLAFKLVLCLVIGMVAIIAVEASISIRRDVQRFQDEMQHVSRQVGWTLKALVEHTWRTSGRARALELIEEADRQEPLVQFRLVNLDARPGDLRRPMATGEDLERIRAGSHALFSERDGSGDRYLCQYERLDADPTRQEALELCTPAAALDSFRRDTILSASLVSGSMLLTSGVLAVGLGIVVIGHPLRQLIEKTRGIGAGDLSHPLALHRRDELGELAAAINQMAEQIAQGREKLQLEAEARIAALEQLRHADRLTTVGRLAAGLAHELGTPLNVVLARAGTIMEESTAEDVVSDANIIRGQVRRMTAIIEQILTFARRRNPLKTNSDLLDLIAQTANLLTPLAQKRNVQISISPEAKRFATRVDAGQIHQVLTNLVTNAIHAMPHGGTVEMNVTSERTRPPNDSADDVSLEEHARIDVQDDGVGIPPENLERIFDPFFTTKDVGEGTGLGLSISYGIVREHGGWIDVSSRVGAGSRFSVYLPLNMDSQAATMLPVPASTALS